MRYYIQISFFYKFIYVFFIVCYVIFVLNALNTCMRVSLSPIIPLTVKHLLFSEAFLIKKIVILTVDFLCFYWRPKISLFKWECINCIQYCKPKYHLLQPVFDLHWTLLTVRYSYRKSYQDDEIVFVYTLPCRVLWNDKALLYLTMSQY